MKGMDTERKLELIQQVRSRYSEDQYDLGRRERILYGRESVRPAEHRQGGDAYGQEDMPSSFRLRVLLAVLLFAAVVVMDNGRVSLFGITPQKIYQVISTDYEDQLEQWVETLSRGR